MAKVHHSALIGFSADSMFELVADIERYPDFLSWCHASELYQSSETEMVASLTLGIAGFSHSITTLNSLKQGKSINMSLDRGPFTHFSGLWEFCQLGEIGCRITLDLEFDFNSKLLNLPFKVGFEKIANKMIDDFCKRAEELYGDH